MTIIESVTQAQRTTVTCPRSHRVRTVPGLELKSSDSAGCLERITTSLEIAHGISDEFPPITLALAGLAQVPHYEFVVEICVHTHTWLANCEWVFYIVFLFLPPPEPEST